MKVSVLRAGYFFTLRQSKQDVCVLASLNMADSDTFNVLGFLCCTVCRLPENVK